MGGRTDKKSPASRLPIFIGTAQAGIFVGGCETKNLVLTFLGIQELLRLLWGHLPGGHRRRFLLGFLLRFVLGLARCLALVFFIGLLLLLFGLLLLLFRLVFRVLFLFVFLGILFLSR